MNKLVILLLALSSCSGSVSVEQANKCKDLAILTHSSETIVYSHKGTYCELLVDYKEFTRSYDINLYQIDAAITLTDLYLEREKEKERLALMKERLKTCLDKIDPNEPRMIVRIKECRKSCGYGF